MPCEPVTPSVPTRPSSSNSTSLAFRMKRLGSGGGARRALTALGTNDTQLNVRLAKSLLTISQEKFALKWNFDPVREVPLPQGRFHWTSTSSPSELQGTSSDPSCRLLSTATSSSSNSSSSSSIGSSSHDLAVTEAEDNAAALRTCLSLPGASETTSTATTAPAVVASHEPRVPPPPNTTPAVVASHEPRVPPPPTSTATTAPAVVASHDPRLPPPPTTTPAAVASQEPRVPPQHPEEEPCTPEPTPTTTSVGSNSSSRPTSGVSDATRGGLSTVDKEVACAVTEATQDNQCQHQIDPTSPSPSPTDNNRHQPPASLTQACITNYLRPRKRSSAHLQEAVHPSKTKKVLVVA